MMFTTPESMVYTRGWFTYSGRFTHISGTPSATGRAQDRTVRRPKTDVIPLYHATNRSVG